MKEIYVVMFFDWELGGFDVGQLGQRAFTDREEAEHYAYELNVELAEETGDSLDEILFGETSNWGIATIELAE